MIRVNGIPLVKQCYPNDLSMLLNNNMNKMLQKFIDNITTKDGKHVPSGTKISDIENLSFHCTPGHNNWKLNVWLKSSTGVPNRTTFSLKLKSIDQGLYIKKLIDEEINSVLDDIFDLGSEYDVKADEPVEEKTSLFRKPSTSDKSDNITSTSSTASPAFASSLAGCSDVEDKDSNTNELSVKKSIFDDYCTTGSDKNSSNICEICKKQPVDEIVQSTLKKNYCYDCYDEVSQS